MFSLLCDFKPAERNKLAFVPSITRHSSLPGLLTQPINPHTFLPPFSPTPISSSLLLTFVEKLVFSFQHPFPTTLLFDQEASTSSPVHPTKPLLLPPFQHATPPHPPHPRHRSAGACTPCSTFFLRLLPLLRSQTTYASTPNRNWGCGSGG